MLFRHAICALVFVITVACHKKSSSSTNPPDNTPVEITSKVIVTGLNFPWELLWGPDDMLWVSERPGKISRVDPNTGNVIPLATIDEVFPNGEGGLLGM